MQQHPDHIADAYVLELRKLVIVPLLEASERIKAQALHALARAQPLERSRAGDHPIVSPVGHRDANPDNVPPHIEHEMRATAAYVAARMRPHELHEVAARFGQQTTDFQRTQLDRQVRHAIGVPLSAIEAPIRDMIPAFTSSNVEIVKTVPDRYFERLRADVTEAFETGMHPDELAERFVDLDGMAEYDAERLARDQIGKLASQVNLERQRSIGIRRGVWRTMHDNRVCDECEMHDGEEFDLDDPPEGEGPGFCHPMDRCFCEPIFEAAEQGGGDEASEGGDEE
jgi:SPP1 gp7 family putative phage head morphogenesis protein